MQSFTQLLARPQPDQSPPKSRSSRLVWAVSLGHMANDICMSMGPVTITFIATSVLSISAAQIGFAISLRDLIGALSQPFFGWLSDRTGGRFQAPGGVAWVAFFMGLAIFFGLQGQFWLMIVPYALSALGSGAFHPVGAMVASEAKKTRAAGNTALFFLGGQTGLALGPFFAGLTLDHVRRASDGLPKPADAAPLLGLALIIVPAVLFMFFTLPNRASHDSHKAQNTGETVSLGKALSRFSGWTLPLIAFFIVLRSIAHLGPASFLPLLFAQKGWLPSEYGAITSAFWIASATAGVFFGWLADRWDRRWVIALSLILGAPLIALLPTADGALAVVIAVATGAFAGGTVPVVVVLIQSLMPGNKGLASGLILGSIFATGAVGSQLLGVLIEKTSFTTGYQVVGVIAVLGCVAALMLPASLGGKHKQSQ